MSKGLPFYQNRGPYQSGSSHTETASYTHTASYNPDLYAKRDMVMLSFGDTAEFVLATREKIEQNPQELKAYQNALRPFEEAYGYKQMSLTDVLQAECEYILNKYHKGSYCRIGDSAVSCEDDIRVDGPSYGTFVKDVKEGNLGAIIAAHQYDI